MARASWGAAVNPPPRVRCLFEELDALPVDEAWAVAADAIENPLDELAELTVAGIVDVLPTAPSRSRRPSLNRAGVRPHDRLAELSPEQRRAIGEALRHGRAVAA